MIQSEMLLPSCDVPGSLIPKAPALHLRPGAFAPSNLPNPHKHCHYGDALWIGTVELII
jgi:hypothetical protein